MTLDTPDETSGALDKLHALRAELRALLVERDTAIDASLGALLSGSHVILLGPPGTAKSMLAHQLCRRLEGASYFQWLLTRFTTPDELFGAVSLAALERDDYRRVTDHKLPEAHIAFLDEVFKASSAILNAILTILNERSFHNGRDVLDVPLLTLFGASNELPDEEELQALYDRFLVRLHVGPVEDARRFLRVLTSADPGEPRATLSLDDLRALRAAADSVTVPSKALHDIVKLRERLADKGVTASDRRWRQALAFLRGMAIVEERATVDDDVLRHLEHCLWSDPTEAETVRAVLDEVLSGQEEEARRLLYQAREIHAWAAEPHDDPAAEARAAIEAHAKLHRILFQVERLLDGVKQRGAPTAPVEGVRDEIAALSRALLGD